MIEGAKYAVAVVDARAATASTTPGFPLDPKIPVADRPGYAEVRFHKLGTDPKDDPVVHEKTGDPTTFIDAELSRDGHWLVLVDRARLDVHRRLLPRPAARRQTGAGRRSRSGATAQFSASRPTRTASTSRPTTARRAAGLRGRPREARRATAGRRSSPSAPTRPSRASSIVGGTPGARLPEGRRRAGSRSATSTGSSSARSRCPGIGSAAGRVGDEDEDEAFYAFTSFTDADARSTRRAIEDRATTAL